VAERGTMTGASARWLVGEPPLDPSGEEGRRWLEDELARPRYDVEESLWRRFVDWLLGGVDGAGGLPVSVGLVLVVLALAALGVVLGRVLRPEARARPGAGSASVLDDSGLDAAAYRARAAGAARRRDWDGVVVDTYRAVVAGAVERAVLDDLPGRTAHEAGEELGRAYPAEASTLRETAAVFDRVRYGHDSADEKAAMDVLALDDRIARARPVLTPAGAR